MVFVRYPSGRSRFPALHTLLCLYLSQQCCCAYGIAVCWLFCFEGKNPLKREWHRLAVCKRQSVWKDWDVVPAFLFVQNALCGWNIFYRKVETKWKEKSMWSQKRRLCTLLLENSKSWEMRNERRLSTNRWSMFLWQYPGAETEVPKCQGQVMSPAFW